MQNEAVGQFVDKYFVASWEQKGNFEVRKGRWGSLKNGGNVVTYFCTPDGRVIHFVAGPVHAENLLNEMQWAVQAYSKAVNKAPTSLKSQTKTLQKLHHRSSPERNLNPGGKSSRSSPEDILAALEKIERELKGKTHISAHRYLTYYPLPPLRKIEKEVFARFADEDVRTEEDDKQLADTIATLEKYRRARKPALLVISPPDTSHHDNKWKHHGTVELWGHDAAMKAYAQGSASTAGTAARRKIEKIRSEFGITRLSRDQLPALSAKLSAAEAQANGESDTAPDSDTDRTRAWFAATIGDGPQVYVLNHEGQLVSAVPTSDPVTLAAVMRRVLQATYVEQAEAEFADDNGKEGQKKRPNMKTVRQLVRKIEAWPVDPSLEDRVGELKRRIRERGEAARAFKLARRLFRKDPVAARPKLEALVADFPNTPSGEKARELLKQEP